MGVLPESVPSLLGLLVSAVVDAKLIDVSTSSTRSPSGTVCDRAVSCHKPWHMPRPGGTGTAGGPAQTSAIAPWH